MLKSARVLLGLMLDSDAVNFKFLQVPLLPSLDFCHRKIIDAVDVWIRDLDNFQRRVDVVQYLIR